MATRSTIAIEYADGTVDQIYCHWDGYLSNNGNILRNSYMDPFKVQKLMDAGDMSSLDDDVEGCSFYSERGEVCPANRFKDFGEYVREGQREEYDYILRQVNGKAQWFVSFYGTDDEYLTIEEAFEFNAMREEEEA